MIQSYWFICGSRQNLQFDPALLDAQFEEEIGGGDELDISYKLCYITNVRSGVGGGGGLQMNL
jgi:hypothetical protein